MSIKDETSLKFKYYPRILKKFVKNVWDIGKAEGPQRLPLLCIAIVATLFSPFIALILTLIHLCKAVIFSAEQKTSLITNIRALDDEAFIKWVKSVNTCQANTDEGEVLKSSLSELLNSIERNTLEMEGLKDNQIQKSDKLPLLGMKYPDYVNNTTENIDINAIVKKIDSDLPKKISEAIINLKKQITLFVEGQIFDDEDFLWGMHVAYHELQLDDNTKIFTRTKCEIEHFINTYGVKHKLKADKLMTAKSTSENTVEEIKEAANFYRIGKHDKLPTRCYHSIFSPPISTVVIEGYKMGVVKP